MKGIKNAVNTWAEAKLGFIFVLKLYEPRIYIHTCTSEKKCKIILYHFWLFGCVKIYLPCTLVITLCSHVRYGRYLPDTCICTLVRIDHTWLWTWYMYTLDLKSLLSVWKSKSLIQLNLSNLNWFQSRMCPVSLFTVDQYLSKVYVTVTVTPGGPQLVSL